MPNLIADCGSSWSKIKNLDNGEIEIMPTRSLLENKGLRFQAATGHLGRERTLVYENELVALAQGSLKLISESDFTVIDVGSRDTKFVSFRDRKVRKLDWNQACGASTGFTLELLGVYYNIDFAHLHANSERIPVTCGVFAIEKIFDSIIHGASPEIAVAGFVHGIAYNTYNFSQCPKTLYLSGGLCENACFLESLSQYCTIIPLGRNVLLEGLISSI